MEYSGYDQGDVAYSSPEQKRIGLAELFKDSQTLVAPRTRPTNALDNVYETHPIHNDHYIQRRRPQELSSPKDILQLSLTKPPGAHFNDMDLNKAELSMDTVFNNVTTLDRSPTDDGISHTDIAESLIKSIKKAGSLAFEKTTEVTEDISMHKIQ